jgi:hypothetical protein
MFRDVFLKRKTLDLWRIREDAGKWGSRTEKGERGEREREREREAMAGSDFKLYHSIYGMNVSK